MTLKKILLTTAVAVVPVLLAAQGQPQSQAAPAAQAAPAPAAQAQGQGGLDPASMLKPLAEEWTSYSGDYTGRRYSTLTQVNQTNVKNLTLAWVSKRVTVSPRMLTTETWPRLSPLMRTRAPRST